MNAINPDQSMMSEQEISALQHDGFTADILDRLNAPSTTSEAANTMPPTDETAPIGIRDFDKKDGESSGASAVLDLILNLPSSTKAETAHLFLQLASAYEQLRHDGLVGVDGFYSTFENPLKPHIEKRFAFLGKHELGPVEHEHLPLEVRSQLSGGTDASPAVVIEGITIAEALDHTDEHQWVRRVSYMLSDNTVFVAPMTAGYELHQSPTNDLLQAGAKIGILSRGRSTKYDPDRDNMTPNELVQLREQLKMQRSIESLNKLWSTVGHTANRAILARYKAETDALPSSEKDWLQPDFAEEYLVGNPPNVHYVKGETREVLLGKTRRLRQTGLNEQPDADHSTQLR